MEDAPSSIHDVTGLALELVFLRLRSLADLVRAAAACKPWRRVIADAGFLRVFRARNPRPPAAGDYYNDYRSSGPPSRPVVSIRPTFVPAAGGCIGVSNFRVMCEYYRECVAHAAVFFFTGGGAAAGSWTERAIDVHVVPKLNGRPLLGRAGGSWYFFVNDRTLAVLDGHTGEYSPFVLPDIEDWPPNLCHFRFRVTDGRDGKPRILCIVGSTMKVFARQGCCGSGEWLLEKSVLLQEAAVGLPGYHPSFFEMPPLIWSTGPGFVTLRHGTLQWLFSVDLETMEAKPAADEIRETLYPSELPWPPTLHACT